MAGLRASAQLVIIRAPLLIDSRDNTPWRDWDNAIETVVNGCFVQPFPLAEKLNFEENRDREFARTAVRMWVPPTTDVTYTDRVRYNNRLYDVFGDPGLWISFDAQKQHISFIARYREG